MPWDRCEVKGYLPKLCSENIIISHSEEEAMNGWLASCGHYNNIMAMSNKELGVWRTGDKWVQVFGQGESDESTQDGYPDPLKPLEHNPSKGYAPIYGYALTNNGYY